MKVREVIQLLEGSKRDMYRHPQPFCANPSKAYIIFVDTR